MSVDVVERHPHWRPRLARALRWIYRLRGGARLGRLIVGSHAEGRFLVRNRSGVFEGDLSSDVDRSIYCQGGYENDLIAAFSAACPRRRVILDVGANVGTHSLAFSKVFEKVHSFEPSPEVNRVLRRNLELNGAANVQVHQIALGDATGTLEFYLPDTGNLGSGTLSARYGGQERATIPVSVETGDDFVSRIGLEAIDAIKIDVEGFEKQVLTGLRGVLANHRPVVWVEIGLSDCSNFAVLSDLIPYPFGLFIMNGAGKLMHSGKARLRKVSGPELSPGNYLVLPA